MAAHSKEVFLRRHSFGIPHGLVLAGALAIAGCPTGTPTLANPCVAIKTFAIGDTARAILGGPQSCAEPDSTYEDFYDVTVGQPQANLRIWFTSPPLIASLLVLDSTRNVVANSAYPGAPDSSGSVRVMLAPGTYEFAVRGKVAGAKGAYVMSAEADTAAVDSCGATVWLTRGVNTSQTLTTADCKTGGTTNRYYHPYLMVLLSGTTIAVAESSTAFTPAATLFSQFTGSQNSTLDKTGTVATITGLATQTDAYQVQASTVNALQTGAYKLTVK